LLFNDKWVKWVLRAFFFYNNNDNIFPTIAFANTYAHASRNTKYECRLRREFGGGRCQTVSRATFARWSVEGAVPFATPRILWSSPPWCVRVLLLCRTAQCLDERVAGRSRLVVNAVWKSSFFYIYIYKTKTASLLFSSHVSNLILYIYFSLVRFVYCFSLPYTVVVRSSSGYKRDAVKTEPRWVSSRRRKGA